MTRTPIGQPGGGPVATHCGRCGSPTREFYAALRAEGHRVYPCTGDLGCAVEARTAEPCDGCKARYLRESTANGQACECTEAELSLFMAEILLPHEQLGSEIVTDWHDGPLRSMRAVICGDGDRLVQVDTILATVGEPRTIGRDANVRDVTVRFDRAELIKMLAVIDGRPVEDWRDDPRISVVEDA